MCFSTDKPDMGKHVILKDYTLQGKIPHARHVHSVEIKKYKCESVYLDVIHESSGPQSEGSGF